MVADNETSHRMKLYKFKFGFDFFLSIQANIVHVKAYSCSSQSVIVIKDISCEGSKHLPDVLLCLDEHLCQRLDDCLKKVERICINPVCQVKCVNINKSMTQ